jgi:phosphoheptose isomerase
MACGTPVLGSNVGGIKFTIRDGETGYLVPPKDPDVLSDKMAYLYANPKLLTLFGRQAIQRVNDLFTWTKITNGLSALYEQVLNATQPADIQTKDHLASVDAGFDVAIESLQDTKRRLRSAILEVAQVLSASGARGGKVLICASPGRADAAERLALHFHNLTVSCEQPGIPALSLKHYPAGSDSSRTEDCLAKQVKLFGRPEDVLIGLDFDEDSLPLRRAIKAANECGMHSIAIIGIDSGDIRRLATLTVALSPPRRETMDALYAIMLQVLMGVLQQHLTAQTQRQATASPLHSMWKFPRPVKGTDSRHRTAAPRVITR